MWFLQSAKGIATTIFGFIVAAIVTGLISANVRVFASKRGLDTFLDRLAEHPRIAAAVRAVVERYRLMIAGWGPLQRRWWLWLALGLSGGVMTTLWAIPNHEIQSATVTVASPQQLPTAPPQIKTAPYDIPLKLAAIDTFVQQSLGDQFNSKMSAAMQLLRDAPQLMRTGRGSEFRESLNRFRDWYNEWNNGAISLRQKNAHYEDIVSLISIPNEQIVLHPLAKYIDVVTALGDNSNANVDPILGIMEQDVMNALAQVAAWRNQSIKDAIKLRETISR